MEDLVITHDSSTPGLAREKRALPMKVLVTGADGYIGSVLTPLLMGHGLEIVGLDTGYYRQGLLYHDGKDRPMTLTRDVRNVTAKDLEGFDAVVHLAELSNDPLCAHDPEKTFEINHLASVALAKNAKAAGVARFVYTSSCSVYGAGGDDTKTELSEPNPQTAYAKCKTLVERDVAPLADNYFCPTFLRNATAFGVSPRMRFDIVVNNLSGLAWTTKKITMTSDGSPWRPLVHVRDICNAIIAALESPRENVCGEIFNVGSDANNYRVREIAEAVQQAFPDCKLEFGKADGDNRSYRVNFDKISKHMPTFKCERDVLFGARQLRTLFERIDMDQATFNAPPYTRLKMLEKLARTAQVDSNFKWHLYDF
jgi:nucleoside-diphosphate-sugar epimerase